MYKEITIQPKAIVSRYLKAGLTLKDSEQKDICPICKSKDIFPITQLINNQNQNIVERSICSNCGHQFFSRSPSKEWYSNFYAYKWDNNPNKVNEIPAIDYSPVSDFLIKNLNSKSNILDLGCGYGTAMKHFKSLGFNNVFGIDPSNKRIEVASRFGFNAKVANAEDLTKNIFGGKTFDIAYSWHAFEHMIDPLKAIQNIYNILSDDSYLFICVPNAEAEHTIMQSHFLPHFHSFSISSLSELFEKVGFQIIHIDDSIRIVGHKSKDKKRQISKDKKSLINNFSIMEKLNRKIDRDFDTRKRNKNIEINSVISFSPFRGSREILEPSFGRLEKIGLSLSSKLGIKLATRYFGVNKQKSDILKRFVINKLRPVSNEYRLWGKFKLKQNEMKTYPLVKFKYDSKEVFPWVK